MYLEDKLRQKLELLIKKSLTILDYPQVLIKIDYPPLDEYGDYSTNVAFILSKQLSINPSIIGQKLIQTLETQRAKFINQINFAKPGFINFKIKEDLWLEELKKILSLKENYGSREIKNKRILIDYSSPNIAKSFSIGHLASTLIGQALANIYSFLGWQVIADNHLGDWGSQFGMIIAAVERKNLDINQLSLQDLEKLYVEYNQEIKTNPDLKKISQQAFKRLESGDKKAKKIWIKAVELSLQEFNRIYRQLKTLKYSPKLNYQDKLPIKYLNYGESFYLPYIPQVINLAKKQKLIKKDNGSLIIPLTKPPAILIKSDGASTYFSRDLATIYYRQKNLHSDIYLYEVGSEQSLYFQQLFTVAKKLGLIQKEKLIHLKHGLVRLPEGKMSTRRGRVIKVSQLIDKIITEADKLITNPQIKGKEREKVKEAIGLGALKFNQLKRAPQTNYLFKWQEALDLKANSGPYLQYTYARCLSVLAKSKKKIKPDELKTNLNSQEKLLNQRLSRFPFILTVSGQEYSPNILASYLMEIAKIYNTFYNSLPILKTKDEKRNLRLALTQATAIILKVGLTLLGIEVVEKM